MKTKISTIILIAAAALTSCSKNSYTDTPQSQPQPSGKFRTVTITAGSAQTKTYVDAGTLKWSDKDKLNIVDQAGQTSSAALDLKSGKDTDNGTFEGQIDASIENDTNLYGWCGGSWTYSSGSFSVDMPATQTYVANGLAKDAYPSIGTGSIKNGIALSNPMGVLKLTVKGASTDLVKSITVTSAANNLAGSFTVDPSSSYAVSGGSSKTITLNVASPYVALSSTGVNFYIVVPPATYAASDLSVKITFSNDEYLNNTLADEVSVTAGKATNEEITVSEDKTGRRGILNGQEYVLIKAKYNGTNDSYLKWATQNLAVTASGKGKWNSTNYVIGDYFQWAASYAGYGITADADKVPTNLVIYTSFTNTFTKEGNSLTFKSGKTDGFKEDSNAPYCAGSNNYTKYTGTGEGKDGKTKLEPSDDVANIVLGSTWRIPTGGSAGEIKAMKEATYWAWDATDKGYYVFKPEVGTSGAANGRGTIAGTDDKTKALLFFPAAGNGSGTSFTNAGSGGHYWSSSFYSINPYIVSSASCLTFNSSSVTPGGSSTRCYGFPVRPVSD